MNREVEYAIVGPPNDRPRIETMTAYIASDEGGEGICAFFYENSGWVPMVGADEERMLSLRAKAQEISTNTGKPIKIARFRLREDLETLTP